MKSKNYSDIQKKILNLIYEKPIKQSKLAKILKKTRSTIKYHIDLLYYDKLIEKNTIIRVGGVKINEISINKLSLHLVREILGIKCGGLTLVTGFGKLEKGYQIPDISYRLLLKDLKSKKINKIICFTTPDALEIRKKKEQEEKIIALKDLELYQYDYKDYRNIDTIVFEKLHEILLKEIQNNNVILDLTPLTKLFSFKLLEYSDQFNIASFYIGKNTRGEDYLIWFRK